MSLKSKIQPAVVQRLFSEATLLRKRKLQEGKRRLLGRPHRLEFYCQLDDPYSLLLARLIPALAEVEGGEVEIVFRLVGPPSPGAAPEAELLTRYGVRDAAALAREHGLDCPEAWGRDGLDLPNAETLALGQSILSSAKSRPDFAELFVEIATACWNADRAALEKSADAHRTIDPTEWVDGNERRRARRGHYLGGVIEYGGEWYWGLDRIHYLVQRLKGLGRLGRLEETLKSKPYASAQPLFYTPNPSKPVEAKPNDATPRLEYYYSFRSPYSYLSLERTFALADATGAQLVIRPVLPMVMRGYPIPRAKRFYIMYDCAREARRLGVPFGRVADPVGSGVERCMAIYDLARREGLERAWLLNAGRGIWSEGIDVAEDVGLRIVVERTGLDWGAAQRALGESSWKEWAEANRRSIFELGLWGVPSYRVGDRPGWWGQDRIERVGEELTNDNQD